MEIEKSQYYTIFTNLERILKYITRILLIMLFIFAQVPIATYIIGSLLVIVHIGYDFVFSVLSTAEIEMLEIDDDGNLVESLDGSKMKLTDE